MATKLEKDVIRESTAKAKDREIIVTLSAKQEVSLKLKGMKSGGVSITIDGLYSQLTGDEVVVEPTKSKKVSTSTKGNSSINLHDLRAHNAIADMDYDTKAKFDQIIKTILDNQK